MGTTCSSAYDGDESCLEKASEACFLRFEGAMADVCAGLVLYGRGGRNGIATANLEARKRVR
jgi:hypothetical protein